MVSAPMPPSTTKGGPGKVRPIGTSILLAIVTLGIYTYVWTYKTHEEIKSHSGEGIGGALGFVVYFLISPVTWFLIPSEINKMEASEGRSSTVKGTTGLWILLPLLGAFIWFPKVQGALNAHWAAEGAAA